MVGSSLELRKTERKIDQKAWGHATSKHTACCPGSAGARRPDAAMRARLTLGGRRRQGDRTPRWPENAKTKEAGPSCSAAVCRARRRWARSRAACRAQATTGAAPRTPDDSDHNETNDDAAQATCAWSRGESRTGHVWSALACTHDSARRHYECVSPPVKRVSAAFYMSGRGVGYFSRTISHRMDTVAAAGSSPPATNLEHCAARCCCQNGRASGPACKVTEKVTDNGDTWHSSCLPRRRRPTRDRGAPSTAARVLVKGFWRRA